MNRRPTDWLRKATGLVAPVLLFPLKQGRSYAVASSGGSPCAQFDKRPQKNFNVTLILILGQ